MAGRFSRSWRSYHASGNVVVCLYMLRDVAGLNPPVDGKRIAAFEKAHSLSLPPRFKEFIKKFNGGRPVPGMFPIDGFRDNPWGRIQAFFGIDSDIQSENLDSIMAELGGRIPRGILPVGCTEGDDFVCVDLRRATDLVVYWDRRSFWGTSVWNEADLYFVANSFAELLRILRDG